MKLKSSEAEIIQLSLAQYILDKHDEHYLRAYQDKEMVMACVFNPPITGKETHDENGVYPLVD